VLADPAEPPAQREAAPSKEDASRVLPADSVTHHSIETGGKKLDYTATAGTLPLYGPKGEAAAKVFYIAYTLDGAQGRPVTFAFNGGPGAASAFLHLGAMGPRAINFNGDGSASSQPVRLSDNPDNWLDFTDLVFIDPVGTGFSRAPGGQDAEKAFWSVEKDADALASIVRLYLTRNGRDLAPAFLAGESYGGFRVPHIARRLLGTGLQVKGLILISPVLEFIMKEGDEFLLTPLVFDLPSITASHIEMTEGPNAEFDAVHEAERFARGDYLSQLAAGKGLDEAALRKLSQFTGLDPKIIVRRNGRVSSSLFKSEYKRETDRSLSSYDGSISAPRQRPSESERFDLILDGAINVLAPAMTQYLRGDLGFATDIQYRLLNPDVGANWDFGMRPGRQGFAGALHELQRARTRYPALKVLIAHGYTDLVVPYAASQFLVDQLNLIDTAAPIAVKVYKGGHMMYLRPVSRRALHADAAELYKSALVNP